MTLPADAPPPRLCIVEKRDGEKEYGYNLHAEKGRGQFVGLVDAGSPAERGGLVTGDRIFAVNGHSIIGENHKKVVERIKGNPDRCEMLVISDEGAKWYQEHNIQVTLDLPNIHRVTDTTYRPSNGSPPPSSWYAPTTYSQGESERFVISSALRLFYSYSLPPRPKMDPSWRDPATWLPYLYTSLLYYLSLIAANLNLPPRITGGDADGETREHVIAETQTERGEVAPSASAADSPPPPPPTLQHLFPSSPHLCVATREVEEEEEEDVTSSPNRFVSTLSFSPSATTFSRRRPPPPPSSSCSIPSSTVSFQHRRTIRTTSFGSDSDSDSDTVSHSNSQISSLFRHNPIRRSQSVIALIPSNSHVLIGIPKLSWRSESIRIRRTRMSEWLDEQQRDVMRQFDEVIRNEEEEEEQQKSMKKKGILKNGSVRSIGSLMSASKSTLQETPVFVPPPPPPNDAMLPRLAKLEKTRADEEFGFNLHAERGRGHFIGTVDAGGIGERAGLEEEQRIVGVNGQLIYPNTSHKEVVALIKKFPMSTTLLVASESVDKYHRDHNIPFSFENVEIRPAITVETHHHQHQDEVKSNGYEAPSLNPHSIQVNEEREISKVTTTTKTEVISTNTGSYQYKESSTTYNTNVAPLAPEASDDLMSQVFGNIVLPPVGNQVTLHSATREEDDDASSVTSLSSSHRESAVDVPVDHKYVPSYTSQSHHHEDRHSQTQLHQQPSPLSNGSSHGYAASSTSGYDDDDIYHLSAKEARERLRMKNRKHHLHEMSLNEKYQLVSNM